jgi:hypothetical protein
MTTEQFVKSVKIQTNDAAVDGTIHSLEQPPGRKMFDELAINPNFGDDMEHPLMALLREFTPINSMLNTKGARRRL